MKKLKTIIAVIAVLCSVTTFSKTISIIPYPQKLKEKEGYFVFHKNINFSISPELSDSAINVINQFKNKLKTTANVNINRNGFHPSILFRSDVNIPFEGYRLNVSTDKIMINASSPNGFFYALQTIYQLLPAEIYQSSTANSKEWKIPCVEIEDSPRFSYRGLHLDVSRHFFPVSFIKKYLDAMAMHKLNRFHWHLTDDQGWRIQIKKYPLLTQTGASRSETLIGQYYDNFPQLFDGKSYGGYYTQEEAREIVKYAADRFITVIPEIEMPGHATAALAAYPEFSCQRTKINVATKWGIFEDVYCTRDTTFRFLEDILSEIMDIFPSKYIHIGGDECPKSRWKLCPDCQQRIKSLGLKDENELQSYFIHRIEKFVNSKGRQIIGWDEILEGGLAPNATVMSWQGTQGGIAAAKNGHDVVMTPGQFCYFDKYQDEPINEPLAIGGLLRLHDVYNYEPVPPTLNTNEAKHILGAQANLWTEYIDSPQKAEYMVFPRIDALSEVLWTKPENKNEHRFNNSLSEQFKRYALLNIQASKAFYNISSSITSVSGNQLKVALNTNIDNAEIRFTLDGSLPNRTSEKYQSEITLTQNSTVRAMTFLGDKPIGKEFSKQFAVNKATGLTYTRKNMSDWQNGGSAYSLTDGIYGDTKTVDKWQAIGGNSDREIIIDMKTLQSCSSVSIGFLFIPAMRGLIPPSVTVSLSTDGKNYEEVARQTADLPANNVKSIYRPALSFPTKIAEYIKLTLQYAGDAPGVAGVLQSSTTFVDEIEIN